MARKSKRDMFRDPNNQQSLLPLLPIVTRKGEIIELFNSSHVSIITVETTTEIRSHIVQYLVESGLSKHKNIVCTLTNKSAVVSLEKQFSNARDTDLREIEMYKPGSEVMHSPSRKVILMTDYLLLRELSLDQSLRNVSCVMVIDAHESLLSDLLLGMMKRILSQRSDFKVIILTVTCYQPVIQNYFSGCWSCKCLEVAGRPFPVEVDWLDNDIDDSDFEKYLMTVVKTIQRIHSQEPAGDILVFVKSPLEADQCCKKLQSKGSDENCFQFHGQTPPNERLLVLNPQNQRKIVFTTNYAETATLVPGITYIVDTGRVKEMSYDPVKSSRSLKITFISRNSAERRKNMVDCQVRGKCYRLYTEGTFKSMDHNSQPKLTLLSNALLMLAEFGIDPEKYTFLHPPAQGAITATLKHLEQLGAIVGGRITELGQWVVKLPVDPKLGVMMYACREEDHFLDSVVLAAIMNAEKEIFCRCASEDDQSKLEKSKQHFIQDGGDQLTALAVYREFHQSQEKEKWCKEHYIDFNIMESVTETIKEISIVLGKNFSMEFHATDTVLRRMIYQCYRTSLCHLICKESAVYYAAGINKLVFLHKSSCFSSSQHYPEWIVYDQLIVTSQNFITGITPIEDSWLTESESGNLEFSITDVRNKTIHKVYTKEAGQYVFNSLVGLHNRMLQEYEEIVSAQIPAASIAIDANRAMGELNVFSTEPDVSFLKETLEAVAKAALEELQNEDWEEPLGEKKPHVRAVLGKGGEVTQILNPTQTRTVYINTPSPGATEETIKNEFQKYGVITNCTRFEGTKVWGILTFQTVEQASEAVKKTKRNQHNIARLEKREASLKGSLTGCMAQGKGIGFVTVNPIISRLVEEFIKEKGKFTVEGKYVTIEHYIDSVKGKIENKFCLKNLPHDVTKNVVQRSLLHALNLAEDDPNNSMEINIKRERPDKSTNEEKAKEPIKRKIEQQFPNVKCTVVETHDRKSSEYTGSVQFPDDRDKLEKIKNLKIGQNKMKVAIVDDIFVLNRVMDVNKIKFKDLENEIKNDGIKLQLDTHSSKNLTKVHIEADDLHKVDKAKSLLNAIFKGTVLNCSWSSYWKYRYTSKGQKFVQKVNCHNRVYIHLDWRLKTISLYGDDDEKEKVRTAMEEHMSSLSNEPTETIFLKDRDKPPGLMKALLDKYGTELDELLLASGLSDIQIHYGKHRLKCTGSHGAIQKVREIIMSVEEKLSTTAQNISRMPNFVQCAVCFFQIKIVDLYRLQICGHPFCYMCLKQQMVVAISNGIIPVKCCKENCSQALAWRDVKHLVDKSDIRLPDFVKAAVSAYVSANQDFVHFCSTPDCPVIYRVSGEDNVKDFLCPECGKSTCTACHSSTHKGVTCAMKRSSNKESDCVKKWVKDNPEEHNLCPKCKVPIKKDGGCPSMTCESCRTLFCWLCNQKFDSVTKEIDQYEHKKSCPGVRPDVT